MYWSIFITVWIKSILPASVKAVETYFGDMRYELIIRSMIDVDSGR